MFLSVLIVSVLLPGRFVISDLLDSILVFILTHCFRVPLPQCLDMSVSLATRKSSTLLMLSVPTEHDAKATNLGLGTLWNDSEVLGLRLRERLAFPL